MCYPSIFARKAQFILLYNRVVQESFGNRSDFGCAKTSVEQVAAPRLDVFESCNTKHLRTSYDAFGQCICYACMKEDIDNMLLKRFTSG